MRVVVAGSADEVGCLVAEFVADRAPSVMGVATGSSPMPAYAEIVRRRLVGRSTRLCLLDEYVGLPREHPQRYRQVISRALAVPLGIAASQVHAPDVDAADLDGAAAAYERELCDLGGIELQVLGIGRNGHIGFNEPGTDFASLTHVATLDDSTCADNARFFDGIGDVPRTVITQGLATIRRARAIVLIATGAAKRRAIQALLAGRPTADVPATCLCDHPDITVIGDREALGDGVAQGQSDIPTPQEQRT